jgi:hypothetical protein
MLRKRRTREHVIADLAVHHVEGFVLQHGWTVERFWHDYGYDLNIFTYNAEGEIETESIYIQVKATDTLRQSSQGDHILFSLEVRDLLLWQQERLPVILVIYDAQQGRAFWLHIQGYFAQQPDITDRIYVNVQVPVANLLSETALDHFKYLKEEAFNQLFRRDF